MEPIAEPPATQQKVRSRAVIRMTGFVLEGLSRTFLNLGFQAQSGRLSPGRAKVRDATTLEDRICNSRAALDWPGLRNTKFEGQVIRPPRRGHH